MEAEDKNESRGTYIPPKIVKQRAKGEQSNILNIY